MFARPTYTLLLIIIVLLASFPAKTQELPGKIRGYRLHRSDITFALINKGESIPNQKPDLLITIDTPLFSGVSLTSARIAVTGEIESFRQDGEVDFVIFRDMTINGIPISISEYTDKFPLKKNRAFRLKQPVIVEANPFTLARLVSREVKGAGDRWRVAGTVLVFGRFRRFGISFKRYIPLKVEVSVRNPLLG